MPRPTRTCTCTRARRCRQPHAVTLVACWCVRPWERSLPTGLSCLGAVAATAAAVAAVAASMLRRWCTPTTSMPAPAWGPSQPRTWHAEGRRHRLQLRRAAALPRHGQRGHAAAVAHAATCTIGFEVGRCRWEHSGRPTCASIAALPLGGAMWRLVCGAYPSPPLSMLSAQRAPCVWRGWGCTHPTTPPHQLRCGSCLFWVGGSHSAPARGAAFFVCHVHRGLAALWMVDRATERMHPSIHDTCL